ncbi:hypothetical protein Q8F55_001058 [Vanrija albida]|uniref:Uncharacterized protein n=1 Tax=Vanrija albida TaxID=181172 RepID=A0ABR3QFP7_9TREE
MDDLHATAGIETFHAIRVGADCFMRARGLHEVGRGIAQCEALVRDQRRWAALELAAAVGLGDQGEGEGRVARPKMELESLACNDADLAQLRRQLVEREATLEAETAAAQDAWRRALAIARTIDACDREVRRLRASGVPADDSP